MTYTVTKAQIRSIMGSKAKAEILNNTVDLFNEYADRYKLDSHLRASHFFGHIAVESGAMSTLVENMNYSASRIKAVWPSRFKSVAAAAPYAGNPRKLANKVYGSRLGNRGSNTDDGYNYRGQGLKQNTGRENYQEFTKWAHKELTNYYDQIPDFVEQPHLLATFPWAFWSAVWFWYTKKVYVHADKDDVRASTKAINGGYIGLDDRKIYITKAKKILTAGVVSEKVAKAPKEPDQLLLAYQIKLNRIAKYRGNKKLNVGKEDGWHGKKTSDALKAFEKEANLPIDGLLDAEVRAAIDNVINIIDKAENSSLAAQAKPVALVQDVEIPEELENKDKPITQSRTLWSTLGLGGFGFLGWLKEGFGSVSEYFSWFGDFFTGVENPYIQMAILLIIAVLLYLVIKSIFQTRDGVTKLKNEISNPIRSTPSALAHEDDPDAE